jgi:hypothetical protein
LLAVVLLGLVDVVVVLCVVELTAHAQYTGAAPRWVITSRNRY